VASLLKLSALDSFTEVVLIYAADAICRLADHDITQTNVIFSAWNTASYANHQPEFDIWEAIKQVRSGAWCGIGSNFWEHCDNNVVASHLTQRVTVGIVGCKVAGWLVFHIKELPCCCQLEGQSTNPTHGILRRVRHVSERSGVWYGRSGGRSISGSIPV